MRNKDRSSTTTLGSDIGGWQRGRSPAVVFRNATGFTFALADLTAIALVTEGAVRWNFILCSTFQPPQLSCGDPTTFVQLEPRTLIITKLQVIYKWIRHDNGAVLLCPVMVEIIFHDSRPPLLLLLRTTRRPRYQMTLHRTFWIAYWTDDWGIGTGQTLWAF